MNHSNSLKPISVYSISISSGSYCVFKWLTYLPEMVESGLCFSKIGSLICMSAIPTALWEFDLEKAKYEEEVLTVYWQFVQCASSGFAVLSADNTFVGFLPLSNARVFVQELQHSPRLLSHQEFMQECSLQFLPSS